MVAKLTHPKLTNIFIKYNVPRDGHLYKYAIRLQEIEVLDANNQRDRARMGFSSHAVLTRFTDRLIQAGIAEGLYDAEGKLLFVRFIYTGS